MHIGQGGVGCPRDGLLPVPLTRCSLQSATACEHSHRALNVRRSEMVTAASQNIREASGRAQLLQRPPTRVLDRTAIRGTPITRGRCVCLRGRGSARAVLNRKKKVFQNQFSQKSTRALHVLNPGWWRLAVGGWQLATGGWWRLVVVGGGWWLVIGGWWRLAVVGSWWLVAAGGLRRLVAGGWWRLVAVGGWRLVAVGG